MEERDPSTNTEPAASDVASSTDESLVGTLNGVAGEATPDVTDLADPNLPIRAIARALSDISDEVIIEDHDAA